MKIKKKNKQKIKKEITESTPAAAAFLGEGSSSSIKKKKKYKIKKEITESATAAAAFSGEGFSSSSKNSKGTSFFNIDFV